jgi:hypothetical protein
LLANVYALMLHTAQGLTLEISLLRQTHSWTNLQIFTGHFTNCADGYNRNVSCLLEIDFWLINCN